MGRRARHTTAAARVVRWFTYLNVVILLVATVFICLWAGGLAGLRQTFAGQRQLVDYRPRLTTNIYSTETHADEPATHTLIGQVYKENRALVPLREIPRYMQQATVAIEDHRFWRHRGVSPRDMLRAAWVNVVGGQVKQGASTITQQLVRNVWLTHERTWDRKFKEILLAIEVERCFSKQEILEMYLNEVYYGHGAYGVGTAAAIFFGKRPDELTVGEAALLAGLPKAPAYYSPFNHPQQAKRRRGEVLAAMQEQGYITADQVKAADEEQIQSHLRPEPKAAGMIAFAAPHFVHFVIRLLCDQYGVDTVYAGGWQVYTTLDVRLQKIAEEELKKQVEKLRAQGRIKGNLVGQGALACIDVHAGGVLAMVGGVGPYEKIQYNRAHPGPPRYGRQPGSSFKPYVWATTLESGYGPNSKFSADPIVIRLGAGKYWRPQNYSTKQVGAYTLRRALAQSVNLVSVRLVKKVGANKVVNYAARMLDIPRERLDAVPALALGVSNLSPLEQASGYCCFANGGVRAKRRFFSSIENHRGEIIVDNPPRLTRVLRPETAVSMVSMMQGVITSGTGGRARVPGLGSLQAGKTGTTQDGRDAWWIGFTPDLCAAIWIGNDDNKPMRGSSGGSFCAPVWREFMKRAVDILGSQGKFPEGRGAVATRPDEAKEEEEESVVATICTQTGQRATEYCPQTVDKLFGPDEQLPGYCTKHRVPGAGHGSSESAHHGSPRTVMVTICEDSGKLATPFCPRTREIEVPADAAPTTRCTLHGPSADTSTPAGQPSGNVDEKPADEAVVENSEASPTADTDEGQR